MRGTGYVFRDAGYERSEYQEKGTVFKYENQIQIIQYALSTHKKRF